MKALLFVIIHITIFTMSLAVAGAVVTMPLGGVNQPVALKCPCVQKLVSCLNKNGHLTTGATKCETNFDLCVDD